MKDYSAIGDAYGRWYDKQIAIRDLNRNTIFTILKKVRERGNIPEDKLFLHHPDDDRAAKTSCDPIKAVRLNEETGVWEAGFLLWVSRGRDIFPEEPLLFLIQIYHAPNSITLRLPTGRPETAFNPANPAEVESALPGFADGVLDAIYDYYEKSLIAWSEGTAPRDRIIGFARLRTEAP